MKFHIEAEIHFLSFEEGGRGSPVSSGYRPQFHYGGQDWDALQSYTKELVEPGETVIAKLSFLSPSSHRGRVYPGMKFELREGKRTVALGSVTRLLDLFD